MLPGRDFILKPKEGLDVPLIKGNRDFWNGSLFKRLTWFYVTLTGNFENFQYLNYNIASLWRIKASLKKIGV